MYISQINQQPKINKKQVNVKALRVSDLPCDTVSFKGHLGSEKIFKDGAKLVLRHETALFRDMQTKNFVKDYINKNFGDKSNIKMVVGACCSGEESFTYSMLLNSLKSKLSIVGFDLSKKSIEQAKTGKVIMQNPKGVSEGLLDMYTTFHKDSFLCFKSKNSLNKEQLEQKKLFDEFFDITPEVYKEKESLGYKIQRWYMAKFLKIAMPSYESKIVKVKDDKLANCTFKEGDILNLKEVTGGEKADVITFSNAMYHLTTDDVANGMLRVPKENSEEFVRNIAKNVKENLNPNGIFVLGENETTQMMDATTVPKVFKELGFEPLNKTEEHLENVWRLL